MLKGDNKMKYTSEQKSEALKSIQDMGVTKTAEALKISVQTLYKWRTEADTKQPEAVKSKGHRNAQVNEMLDVRALLEKIKAWNRRLPSLRQKTQRSVPSL